MPTSFIRRLIADVQGVGVMELALITPVLMLLFLGMVDLSMMATAKIDLEQAAQRTTDFALAKRPTRNDGSYLATEAASAAGVPKEQVTVELFLECNGIRQASFDTPCPTGQVQARFASVEIRRNVERLFDWGAFSNATLASPVSIAGDSVVRFQ